MKKVKKKKKGAGARRGEQLAMDRLFAAGDMRRDWHRIPFLRVAIV